MKVIQLLLLVFFIHKIQAQYLSDAPYFQQRVEYNIKVTLDDQSHFLKGEWECIYYNNADSALTYIYLHLWPNAYQSRNTPFTRHQVENNNLSFYYARDEERGGIDSLNFSIEGQPIEWSYLPVEHPILNTIEGSAFYVAKQKKILEVLLLKLPFPLNSGKSIKIKTPFRVKIPYTFSRMGHTDNQYQITQWYPKPVVLDAQGWHPMPYLDQGEFYSEWGRFDVQISLPKEYKIAATGVLQREFADSKNPKNIIYHFVADSVHDFAWFCDKEYIEDRDTLLLPYSKRIIQVKALYRASEKKHWQEATKYIKEAIYWYSKLVGEYPYPQATAVSGALGAGSGMEYPMITVIGPINNSSTLRRVIVHELGHNWFYGVLASNERLYPWLDEGLNSYYENRIMDILEGITSYSPDLSLKKKFQNDLQLPRRRFFLGGDLFGNATLAKFSYKFVESTNRVQPISLPADWYTRINYGLIVYTKSVFALNYLENYLGQALFDKCMQAYFAQWQFKHPYPQDMQAVFEKVSQKDLTWFFQGLVNTKETVDFKIENVENENGKLYIHIENKSGFLLPAILAIQDKSHQILQTLKTEPFLNKITVVCELEDAERWHIVVINPTQVLPERNVHNNLYYNRSFLPAFPEIELKFLYRLENMYQKPIFWIPALGANANDGFMAGGLFYFQPYPRQHFEFHLMPMYSLGSKRLVGSAGFTLRVFPNEIFRKIEWKTRVAQFSDLFRLKNSITFYFQPFQKILSSEKVFASPFYRLQPNWRRAPIHYLTLRSHQLARYVGAEWRVEQDFRPYFIAIDWHYSMDKRLWEYGWDFELGYHNAQAVRISIAPFISYRYTQHAFISLRSFAGKWLLNQEVPFDLAYRFSGSRDPLGESILLDRKQETTGFLSRQLVADMGGFRSWTYEDGIILELEPYTDDWLVSANLTIQAPVKLLDFVHGFLDIGAMPRIGKNEVRTAYAAGISFSFGKGFFSINYPILGSFYPNTFPDSWDALGQRINFSLEINRFIQRLDF
ncbi:MAG: M1 family metallopeptidase [Bacteroidia bacterium]|nr:M1 family metallopeptidase [Bacteroidia bacterium]